MNKNFLIKFSGYISVFILSAVFILASVVTISESGRTISEIIIDGALGLMFGLLVDSLLGIQGLNNGKLSESFLKTKEAHGKAVKDISGRIHELDSWCRQKNAEALVAQRTKILALEELKYSLLFDEDGRGVGYKSDFVQKNRAELRALSAEQRAEEKAMRLREKRKRRAYFKALHLKLTPLSSASLTGDSVQPDDPYYFGQSEREYERTSVIADTVKKVFTAGIFGYFCVEQMMSFSPAALIWRCLQVSIYIVGGVMKMLSAQSFIVNDYRGQIIKKINYLEMFKNTKCETEVSDSVAKILR